MSNKFTGTRIEFHILQSFPVSCLNRDDMGSPKSALIGGVPRARVSSQCWKRAVRMQMHELGATTAKRTLLVSSIIKEKCLELGASEEQAISCGNCFASILEKKEPDAQKAKKKGAKGSDDAEKESAETTESTPSSALFFISDAEAVAIAEKFKENKFEKLPADTLKKVCKETRLSAQDGLDIALFGRMVANARDLIVEAAASFAHAISTHRVNSEIDFFTALDDCKKREESGGAGHMNSLEFNSATYYRYISLDLGQLAETLRTDDIWSAVEVFTKALFLAFPAARQSTMSAASPWNYAIITVRKGQRIQLSFNDPVKPHADMVAASIESMKAQFEAIEHMYGSLFGLKDKIEIAPEKDGKSIDDVIAALKSDIAAI